MTHRTLAKLSRAFPPGGFVPWWGPGASDILAVAPPQQTVSQIWSGAGTFPAYAPQEYPKMVPGPNGPVVVHDGGEEFEALRARLVKLGPTPSLAMNDEILPKLTPKINRDEVHQRAMEGMFEPNEIKVDVEPQIDVEAWCKAREVSQHDWIGALYRPYEPPV